MVNTEMWTARKHLPLERKTLLSLYDFYDIIAVSHKAVVYSLRQRPPLQKHVKKFVGNLYLLSGLILSITLKFII